MLIRVSLKAVVETDSSETKTGLDFDFETETGKVLDQNRNRKNAVLIGFFDLLKKVSGTQICS